jgi:nitrite reductase/ring-hydroxylating ferredoxin subunit
MENPDVTMVSKSGTGGPNLKGHIDLDHIGDTRPVPQRWIAGHSADIADSGRLIVEVGETSSGIFRVEGQLYAYLNVCPHMGVAACQGKMLLRVLDLLADDKTQHGQGWDETDPHVVCPWHGFEFSIKTGCHAGIPSIRLRPVPVCEEEGVVYVTI